MILRTDHDDICRRLAATDVVCFDLDECLLPCFSQTCVAAGVLLNVTFSFKHRQNFAPLAAAAARLAVLRLGGWIRGKRVPNAVLMDLFERALLNVPIDLMRRNTRWAYGLINRHGFKCVKMFSERKTTGIISQTVLPITEQMQEDYPFLDFVIGNDIREENGRFLGYRNRFSTGEAKLAIFREYLAHNGLECPVIFGHCQDEVPMARYAVERGGVAIGISPDADAASAFDIRARSSEWRRLYHWLRNAISVA
jgi:phosphoserine phosphatase